MLATKIAVVDVTRQSSAHASITFTNILKSTQVFPVILIRPLIRLMLGVAIMSSNSVD